MEPLQILGSFFMLLVLGAIVALPFFFVLLMALDNAEYSKPSQAKPIHVDRNGCTQRSLSKAIHRDLPTGSSLSRREFGGPISPRESETPRRADDR